MGAAGTICSFGAADRHGHTHHVGNGCQQQANSGMQAHAGTQARMQTGKHAGRRAGMQAHAVRTHAQVHVLARESMPGDGTYSRSSARAH